MYSRLDTLRQAPNKSRIWPHSLALGATTIYMLNALICREAEGQSERVLMRMCASMSLAQYPDDQFPDGVDDDFPIDTFNHHRGIFFLPRIRFDLSPRLPANDALPNVDQLAHLYSCSYFVTLRDHFRTLVNTRLPRKETRTANRNRNPTARVHDKPVDDDSDAEVPAAPPLDFGLDALNLEPPPVVEPTGEDIPLEPDALPSSLDVQMQKIWDQLAFDIFSESANPKSRKAPSYILLDADDRQMVTTGTFKSLNLSKIFRNVHYRNCDTKTWHLQLTRYFPIEEQPVALQNFKELTYWLDWRNLLEGRTREDKRKMQKAIQMEFDKLLWIPWADSDRLWTTRVPRTKGYKFLPKGGDVCPCPQIAVNERLANGARIRLAE